MLFVLDFTNDFQLARRFALGKSNQIDFAFTRHLSLEPLRKSIDALRADAMQAAGKFVGSLSELTAGMQVGQNQLDSRHLKFRMRFDGNAASVVTDRRRAVDMNGHVDSGTESRQMLVNRVVQYLKDTV